MRDTILAVVLGIGVVLLLLVAVAFMLILYGGVLGAIAAGAFLVFKALTGV